MKLNKEVKVEFLDGPYTVEIAVERENSRDFTDVRINIDAIVKETGMSLTNVHYGLLKNWVKANKRPKASKSIKQELKHVIQDIIETLEDNSRRYFIKEYSFEGKTSFGHNDLVFGIPTGPVHLASVKSLNSGECVSWHHHDIFRENAPITLHFSRKKDGQPQVHADETELYDFDKLQALADSNDFKEQKFSFFFYNEVKRLLGIPFEDKANAMSGMFGSNIK